MATHSRAISHTAHSAESNREKRNRSFVRRTWERAKEAIRKTIEETDADRLKKAAVAAGIVLAVGAGTAACGSESPNHDTNTDSDTDAEVTDGETDGDALPDMIEDPVDDEIEDGDADEDGEVIPPECPEQEGPLELTFNTDNMGTARTVVTFEGPGGEEITADAELTLSMEGDVSGLTYIGTCDDGETPVYLASPDDSLEFEPQIVSEMGDLGTAGWDATVPEGECGPLESDTSPLRTSGSTTKPIAKNATSIDGPTRALFELIPDLSTYGLYVDGVETSGAFSLASAGFTGHLVVSQIDESEWALGVTTFVSGGSNEYVYTGTIPAGSSRAIAVYSLLDDEGNHAMYEVTAVPPADAYHFFRCGPGTTGGSLALYEMVFELQPTCRSDDPCGCAGDGAIPVIDNVGLSIDEPQLAAFYSIDHTDVVPIYAMSGIPGSISVWILRTNVTPGWDEGESVRATVTVQYHTESENDNPNTGTPDETATRSVSGMVTDPAVRAVEGPPSYDEDEPAGCVRDI